MPAPPHPKPVAKIPALLTAICVFSWFSFGGVMETRIENRIDLILEEMEILLSSNKLEKASPDL